MQSFPACLLTASIFLSGACVASAQERPPQTNAEFDGFKGPIKSVTSTIISGGVQWAQPGGPTMVPPLWCGDCEYAPDGTRTKAGQIVDGVFHGTIIRLVLDSSGKVVERFASDSSTGALGTHDFVGPFGKTKQIFYENGKKSLEQIYSYNEYGYMSELRTIDPTGKRDAILSTKTDMHGEILERSSYSKNGELGWQQTFDPETEIEHLTSFNESGVMNQTVTLDHGKLSSFWEQKNPPPGQAWDNFSEKQDENNYDNYACHPDLKCDVSHVHYEFLNGDNRLPVSVEWRDADDQLRYATYFDYDLDSHQNWTHRRVWVWDLNLGARALSETDSRVISYWQPTASN